MERPNDHVVESIKNYASLNHSPYFALMITGPWGVGKTHLVKSTFNKLNNINYSYISLYGISSNDDIDIAILQSLNPILSSSTAKAVGRVGKAALKYLRIDGVVKPGDFVKPNQEYIYIFDDLERCSMPPEAALGYINEFVEHDGCKVIIIANEEELPDRDSFKDTKEKLIGRTIEVQPDTEHLVENLISQIRNQRTKSLLDESRKIICTIFSEANTKSFRVLQQAIWDFENLADLLDKNHFENRDGITATLRLFLAMALEFKSGELSKQDIIDRPSSMLRAFKRDQPPKESSLESSQKRFSESDLFDSILSNKVLSDILSSGKFIKNEIIQCINSSEYYRAEADEPAWRTVWHGTDRDINAFEEALKTLKYELSERKIEEPNIIIHAAGIHIWLSEIGAIKESKEEIVELFQAYINDLYNQKRLKPSSNSEREFRRYESYGGLGVIHFDSPEVKLLATLMEELRNKAKEDLYPSFAASTLNEMAVDTRLFYRRLNFTNNSDDNSYADIPILASIKPEVFVEKLFELENTDRELVLAAINARHSPPPPGGALAIEIPWISEVVSVIKPKLDTMHAVHRWGLSRAVARYLEALIT